MTDLLYSEVEDDLRASVGRLLTDRCDSAAVLARVETDEPYDLTVWRTLAAELGVAGLNVPENLGGHGASLREIAVVQEELGRTVAPVPFFGSTVLATSALLGTAESSGAVDAAVAETLKRLAAGEITGALAVPLSTAPDAPFPDSVLATENGALTGRVRSVADAPAADVLVVPAVGPTGPGLYAVPADAAGLRVSEVTSLDLTRRIADLTLDDVPARRLAGPTAAPPGLAHALLVGAGMLASEQLGVAQWCLDSTVRHVKERHQFGRPVGSFQALKHRLADLWLELASARAAARYAADTLAAAPGSAEAADARVAVSLAQAYCSTVAVHAAEECVQLHGGIGMTWEHPAHLYLKRAKSDELALGTSGRHRAILAELVDLPS